MIGRRMTLMAAGVVASRAAVAQGRAVTLVVPFAAGGGTDIVARALAEPLGEGLGAPVVVENRAGGGGAVGNLAVVRAPADGRMLLLGTAGTQAISPRLADRPAFDPEADLAPVAGIGATPYLLAVPAGGPDADLAGLLARARSSAAGLDYASAGTGTLSHLCGALLAAATGARLTHIPYRGAGPANVDLAAGRVAFMFDAPLTLLEGLRAGRLRALAVTGPARFAPLPEVPTMAEAGLAGFETAELWLALFAPAATPPAEIARTAEAALRATIRPAVVERLASLGFTVRPEDGPSVRARLAADLARWGGVIRANGIRAE
jgi:tripartite-type tricarboxylate transporter receptor subunit TctC